MENMFLEYPDIVTVVELQKMSHNIITSPLRRLYYIIFIKICQVFLTIWIF